MSCNDCILIYWDNYLYFWKGCGFFFFNLRRLVRRRNVLKLVFIDFIGEFYIVAEVFYYLFCLMYIVLNDVLVCLIGMCVS